MQEKQCGHPTLHTLQKSVHSLEDRLSKLQQTLVAIAWPGKTTTTTTVATADYDGTSVNSDFTDCGGETLLLAKQKAPLMKQASLVSMSSLSQIREEREENNDSNV
jgi:hypothetical protein